MTYHWTDNKDIPVSVDGKLGPQTIKALQYGLGDVTVDGEWGPETVTALQKFLGVSPDGDSGPLTTEALQRRLNQVGDYGLSIDGVLGAQTIEALQKALNRGELGSGAKPTPPSGHGGGSAPISESAVKYERDQKLTVSKAALVQQAAKAAGVTYSPTWQTGYDTLIERESSWNPNAVNDYDSNAVGGTAPDGYKAGCSRGLTQLIPANFAAYHVDGTSDNIYDPLASVAASMLYVMGKWGVDKDGSNFEDQVQEANPNRPRKGY